MKSVTSKVVSSVCNHQRASQKTTSNMLRKSSHGEIGHPVVLYSRLGNM